MKSLLLPTQHVTIPLLAAGLLAVSAASVQAHYLFVTIQPQDSGQDLVDVIFEHAPFPGKGEYNQPLLDRGKTWVVNASGGKEEVTLAEIDKLGKKFLRGETSSDSPRAIYHSCEWGVYKGQMDYFHGKYLDAKTPEQLRETGKAVLPLDFAVTSATQDTITFTLLLDGQPLADTAVQVWSPGKKLQLKTNASGQVKLEAKKTGIYSLFAAHVDKKSQGTFNSEDYTGLMHGTTVSLSLPLEK